ncbi:unnamed protein product [Ectocarpus sp. 12 AP-2014]
MLSLNGASIKEEEKTKKEPYLATCAKYEVHATL